MVKSYDRPIQDVRPSTITKLYRDLLTSGGRDGQPLAVAIVTHLHAVLRKAFRDAVIVDEPIGSNPVERAKWPRAQHKSLIGGERVNGTTKSGRTRVVSIDAVTVAVLRQRKVDQGAEQLEAGDSWRGTKDSDVVTTGRGEPIYPRYGHVADAQAHPGQQAATHARLHDLRHLHATTLLLSGVPVHVVAARLGHADPAVLPSASTHT